MLVCVAVPCCCRDSWLRVYVVCCMYVVAGCCALVRAPGGWWLCVLGTHTNDNFGNFKMLAAKVQFFRLLRGQWRQLKLVKLGPLWWLYAVDGSSLNRGV